MVDGGAGSSDAGPLHGNDDASNMAGVEFGLGGTMDVIIDSDSSSEASMAAPVNQESGLVSATGSESSGTTPASEADSENTNYPALDPEQYINVDPAQVPLGANWIIRVSAGEITSIRMATFGSPILSTIRPSTVTILRYRPTLIRLTKTVQLKLFAPNTPDQDCTATSACSKKERKVVTK